MVMDIGISSRIYPWGLVVALAGLAGCASIVSQPQVSEVKKAAIVSLYANEKVPHKGGMGVVKDWDDSTRLQVAEDALRTYATEMQRLGWTMVSPDEVIQSKEYKATFDIPEVEENSSMGRMASMMKQIYQRQFFAPAGMLPIQLSQQEANTRTFGDAQATDKKSVLAAMAKRLNVDAVVIVAIDYCYDGGTFSLLGTGSAVMTAAASIKAVNQKGEMVINMPDIEMCGDDDRGKSATTALMAQGDLLFTGLAKDQFRKMFIEATRASADRSVGKVAKAMKL